MSVWVLTYHAVVNCPECESSQTYPVAEPVHTEINMPWDRKFQRTYNRVQDTRRYTISIQCKDCEEDVTRFTRYEPIETKVKLNLESIEKGIMDLAKKAVTNVTKRSSNGTGRASVDKRALASDSPGPQRIEIAARVIEVDHA
jgi:hypothetical protein